MGCLKSQHVMFISLDGCAYETCLNYYNSETTIYFYLFTLCQDSGLFVAFNIYSVDTCFYLRPYFDLRIFVWFHLIVWLVFY